jgi:hypothetical protein
VWPCSYDHRELVATLASPKSRGSIKDAKADEGGPKRDDLFKDQQLIFNNSIFCTRSLFRIHIARSGA